MLNVSNKDTWSINTTLFRSAINNRNKELRHISKELSISKNLISKQLSTTDFYILEKSITSHNTKSLQKSLYTHHKKNYHHWRGVAPYLYSQLTKLLLTLCNMNYLRRKPIYLKQVYTFQSKQIKFDSPKSSLPSKRFIVLLLTTFEETKSQIKAHLSYCANSYFYNYKPPLY